MASEAVIINPLMLRWARETAGMDVAVAASKLKMQDAELRSLESGERNPRIAQLKRASDLYRRSIASFFLPAPPNVAPRPHDFRSLPNTEKQREYSPRLLFEIRKARWRRELALDLTEELGRPINTFSEQLSLDDNIANASKRMRTYLNVSLEEQLRWKDGHKALAQWLSAFETRQLLVFQTSRVDLNEMRGISLFEETLPIILLNGKDAARARIFTLIHEFGHLLLRSSATCEPLVAGDQRKPSADARVESFCNAFSAQLLVPTDSLMAQPAVRNAKGDWSLKALSDISISFSVSQEVVLRRLNELHLIDNKTFQVLLRQLQEEYEIIARRRKKKKGGGPSPTVLAARDNGKLFSSIMLSALERDFVTEVDVTNYLGLRMKHFDTLADFLESSTSEAAR